MSWRSCKLGDVMTLKRGHDLPADSRHDGDVPVVSSSGITGRHNESKAKAPGVVTGRYGTIGQVFYLEEDYWPLNTALYVIDFKGNDPQFLAYFLRNALKGYHSEKAAIPGVDRNVLHQIAVRAPDFDTQQRIVAILAAYDDLIEKNRRRMALLEDSARALYNEWFVRLRFPGHEHTPIIDGVPQGWSIVSLAKITMKIGSGSTPRGGDSSYVVEGTPLIRSMNIYNEFFDDSGLVFLDENQASLLAGVTVQSKDILINITGASVARCCMAPENYLPARVNQHVMIIRIDPNKADPFFVHKAINSDERKRLLVSYAQKGATREALTKEGMARVEVTLPTVILMLQFSEIAALSFRQREVLALQNQKLRAARDLLLPRLMSGELAA